MHLYLHKILLSLLICSLAGPALHADTASSTPVKSDINQARITDGNFKFPGIIASDPASVASLTQQTASIAGEIPVQEIPAIDNLLQLATQTQIKTLKVSPVPATQKTHKGIQSAKIEPEAAASGSVALKSGLQPELNKTPKLATASNGIAEASVSAILSETATGKPGSYGAASNGVTLTASETAETKRKKNSEYIDTLFPDPLSPDFPSESGISAAEKNRPVKEVIDEINQKAEEIAERTAKELGIDYVPPSERLPKTETGESAASASGDLASEASEIASGEAKIATEVDTGSWEYPGDTRASATAGIEPAKTVDRTSSTKPTRPVKRSVLASETVVTDTENEIIPVQWPDSPEDPEFATGSQQLFSEKTASATSSSGELPGLFEKAEALAPALMTRGKPENELSDVNEIKKITGRLVPEKQPLGRRRHLYRWVLKTDDGRRIPLKSNLKLLTEVRNEKMLDGKVNLTGRFIKSGMNEELQYFVVESATFADSTPESGNSGTKNAAKKQDLPSGDQNLKKAPLPKQP